MLLTERKAVTLLLEELITEERDLKNYYRSEKARIENQKADLLNRLERMDNLEREAIDTEGVLQSMAETADKLAQLIPTVPVDKMIERAAQLVATESMDSGAAITYVQEETAQQEKAAAAVKKEMEYMPAKKNMLSMDYLEIIADIIRKSPNQQANAKQLQKEMRKRYGWEFKNFTSRINYWRKNHPGIIERKGMNYFVAEDMDPEARKKAELDRITRTEMAQKRMEYLKNEKTSDIEEVETNAGTAAEQYQQ